MNCKQRVMNAIAIGTERKHYDNKGKEWYALYIGHQGNGVLIDWMEAKVAELYPKFADRVKTVPMIYDIYQLMPSFIVMSVNKDVQFIHKRKFKRHLKKALQRNLVRAQW